MLEIVSSFVTCSLTYIIDCLIFRKVTESKNKILTIKNIYLIIFMSCVSIFVNQNYSIGMKLIITNIQSCLLLKIIFNKSLEKTLLLSLFMFLICSISEIIFSMTFVYIMDISTDFLFNTIQGKILGNLIIYAIYVNFFHIKGVKKFIKWLCKFYDNQTKFGIYLLAAFIVILIAAITYPISVHNYSGKNITIFILFYLSALIFITGFFNQKSRNGELKNEYDSLLKYMSEYEKALDEKSKNQHEYKNQLIMIENMIEEKNEKARSYIKQLLNEKENKNVELLNNLKSLPQGGLKGLIYFKAERMIEKGMEVHIHVDEVLDSRKLWNTCEKELQDISRIIGVYIDNAIEATEIADKKYIIIDIEYEKDTIIFSFSNTYKGSIEIDKIDQEGYSTKAKKRGYGLSLVQDIIQKNEVLSQTREINGIFFVQKLIIQNKK